jgi:peptidoglycan/LPS O-acetylase OafA/YrhL
MNRWTILGVIFFGALFAIFAFWRVEVLDSRAAKGIAAAFLFGSYCAIVAFGTAEKKRSLSLAGQTILGVALAITIAALFNASSDGFALAALLGLVLGFTADRWVDHVQLP